VTHHEFLEIDMSQRQDKFIRELRRKKIFHQKTLNYHLSLAFWSIYGQMIGLGDRHCSNCMIKKGDDKKSPGTMFMIDFEYIFDKSKSLPVPEQIDFRATKNFLAPLGMLGPYGLFSYLLGEMMLICYANRDQVLDALDSFRVDQLKVSSDDSWTFYYKMTGFFKQYMNSNGKNQDIAEELLFKNCSDELLREMYLHWCYWY
jgi:phosphatidylinositol kinase/protein kinase (PI-3  family)